MKYYTKMLLANFSGSLAKFLENIANTGRAKKQVISIVIDMLLVVVSLWFAYTLRLDHLFTEIVPTWYIFALLPPVTAVIFAALGVYRWVVRSSNNRLAIHLIKGCMLSALVLLVVVYLFPPKTNGHPRSLFAIYCMVMIVFSVGTRLLWRRIKNFDEDKAAEPVAIYGAGRRGFELAAMMSIDGKTRPVLYLDSNEALVNTTIGDIPVCDVDSPDVFSTLRKHDVSRVILSPDKENPGDLLQITNRFVEHDLDVKIVPSVTDVISGRAKEGEIRDIRIEDVLGRNEIPPDRAMLEASVAGKSVLVTGGGGSIGSELCRQIARLGVHRLVVLDNGEHNLYRITEELEPIFINTLENAIFVPVLGSVTDELLVSDLIQQQQIDTVFHAAAYKHVPIIEQHPKEAIRINVLGTQTVLETAIENGVERFILISTDKAVNPINAMGASKRVAELILQAKAKEQRETVISMVRFGNVLDSSGSVLPKFKEQIINGGPVTVTDPDVSRYFMTIPEAASLVLQASAIAKGGDVFVLDMGEQIRIWDLAEQMVRLYGKQLRSETGNPDDIDIVSVGLRPGEKLSEELFESEAIMPTVIPKISYANEDCLSWEMLSTQLQTLQDILVSTDSTPHVVKVNLVNLATLSHLLPAPCGEARQTALVEPSERRKVTEKPVRASETTI